MNLVNPEICSTCPDRSLASCWAAKIVLGRNHKPRNCEGRSIVAGDVTILPSDDIVLIEQVQVPVCGKESVTILVELQKPFYTEEHEEVA